MTMLCAVSLVFPLFSSALYVVPCCVLAICATTYVTPQIIRASWYYHLGDWHTILYAWRQGLQRCGDTNDDMMYLRSCFFDDVLLLFIPYMLVYLIAGWPYIHLILAPGVSQRWYMVFYAFPILPFIGFFTLDAGYYISDIIKSVPRSLYLLWHELPTCAIVAGTAYLWGYLLSYIPYGYIVAYIAIPAWINLWYVIYTASLYERFSRYYDDIMANTSDSS